MKVGVTRQNFSTVTGHAGKARRRFLVYCQNDQGDWQECDRFDLPKDMSMHEFTDGDHPIDELDLLITGSCGTGFVKKMAGRGIKVVQTGESDPLDSVTRLMSGQTLAAALAHEH